MKTILLTLLAGTFASVAVGLTRAEDASSKPGAAKIQFAEIDYDFGKVNTGVVVKHTFVFTNVGTATLEILDVRPGCGCTTAGTWDKQVEPGKTGSIPLEFNSSNFGGTVLKQATVTCNDPAQSNVVLHIKGTVWKPIDVVPMMAVFNVSDEVQTNDTKVVRIISNLDEPVTLSDLQCTNRSFRAELKTLQPGKEFELHITALPPFTSPSIIAPVTLKTSSTNMPLITVSAYAVVQQAVTVTPNQIILTAGPFTNAVQQVVSIRNAGTNALALSEAKANVPGATVRVQETQPGRVFNLIADFPVGFQIKPGEAVELTVKSSHPKFALIKIPVFQTQRDLNPSGFPAALPTTQLNQSKPPVSTTAAKP